MVAPLPSSLPSSSRYRGPRVLSPFRERTRAFDSEEVTPISEGTFSPVGLSATTEGYVFAQFLEAKR